MLYDSDMERRLSSRGYSVHVFGDMTAMIFYNGRFVDKVRGEWGLYNWMYDREMFEDDWILNLILDV